MTWEISAAANAVIGIAYEKSQKAVEETLRKARMIITELLGDEDSEVALVPGELRRQRPATVAGGDAPT